jgi:hypothetical protein
MVDMHARYPQYDFNRHKGYPTAAHVSAIAKHGPCPIHRRTFQPLKSMFPLPSDDGDDDDGEGKAKREGKAKGKGKAAGAGKGAGKGAGGGKAKTGAAAKTGGAGGEVAVEETQKKGKDKHVGAGKTVPEAAGKEEGKRRVRGKTPPPSASRGAQDAGGAPSTSRGVAKAAKVSGLHDMSLDLVLSPWVW